MNMFLPESKEDTKRKGKYGDIQALQKDMGEEELLQDKMSTSFQLTPRLTSISDFIVMLANLELNLIHMYYLIDVDYKPDELPWFYGILRSLALLVTSYTFRVWFATNANALAHLPAFLFSVTEDCFMVLEKLTIDTRVTKNVKSGQLDYLVPKFREAQARFDKATQRVKDCITYSTTENIPTTLLFIKPTSGPTQEQRDEKKRKRDEGRNKDEKKPTGCLIWSGV